MKFTQNFDGRDGPFRIHFEQENGLMYAQQWESLPLTRILHKPLMFIACIFNRLFARESEE